jgi:hypothetical protein
VAEQKNRGGPGSTPPSCRSKCGWCNPCHPVHVPVQPGFIIRLEYYPEAWRCKCGNKLFLPWLLNDDDNIYLYIFIYINKNK